MKRVVLLLGLAGLLTACGGGSKTTSPQALPPVTAAASPSGVDTKSQQVPGTAGAAPTSPSPSASPAPAPSSAPPGEPTAEAAARTWVDAVNNAYRAVDPAGIVSASSPGCAGCMNFVLSLKRAAAAGEHYRGGQIHVRDAVAPVAEDGKTIVLVDVFVDELKVLDRAGAVVRSIPAVKRGTLNVGVQEVRGRWVVTDVTRS